MIICCGESLIDMISVANAGNESVYAGLTGGAIFNTSIALGRLDVPVGLISGVSTDLFGEKIKKDLTESNVNIKLLIRNEKANYIRRLLMLRMDKQIIHFMMKTQQEIAFITQIFLISQRLLIRYVLAELVYVQNLPHLLMKNYLFRKLKIKFYF
jgi:sugar/nucleoside kinase (ribokinase family)